MLECNRGLIGVLLSTGQIAAASQVADQLRMTADRTHEIKGRPGVMIRVNQALARLALEQGRFDQAEAIINATLKTIDAGGRSALSLRAISLYKMLAELDMLRNRWDRALEAQVAGRAFEPGHVAGGVAPGGGIAALAESELAPVRPDRERNDVRQREALADPVGVFSELSGDLLQAALPEGPRRGARWEGCHGSSPRRGKR